ncbi:MAG: alpha-L-fucosidase [Bryobacterales bacterium]|nr:alpha-L-fucosidase [Bryobacterales bacterium]
MNVSRRGFLWAAAAGAAAMPGGPKPYGAVPSARQLLWHELEVYAFLHFTVNTFTDKEWGYGDEDPNLFAPTAFDADAIVSALEAGGMKGVILTCKHHDGFCLWPTKTTEHCVRASRWKGGKGDVVKEVSDAARRRGLKFGVYLSPWDRNSALYGGPDYVKMYRQQLRELLTEYGPVYEVWHDGANGGDGYYGGAREKRTIDKRTYYDWPRTWEMVRKLQPDAVIFSDVGPDIRWVGNEKGFANETCWATYDPVGEDGGAAAPGYTRYKEATTGHRNGKHWLPAECDVSIRPGWFFHESQNGRVKSAAELWDLYAKSVGRGASFLLNVPPDRRGLIHERDAASLQEFGTRRKRTFGKNLVEGAKVTASSVRGRRFGPENLVDGNRHTYWSSEDTAPAPEVVVDLGREARFDVARLREYIPLGQRVEGFALEYWKDGGWRSLGEGTSVGACRLVRLAEAVTARKVRLRVTQSPVCVALSELGLYSSGV